MDQDTFFRVEYDANFSGGDYNGVGDFMLVSSNVIDQEGGVEAAFSQKTGLPSDCIIHFTVDELYDINGNVLDDTLSSVPRSGP
jgi:hypothetical protein